MLALHYLDFLSKLYHDENETIRILYYFNQLDNILFVNQNILFLILTVIKSSFIDISTKMREKKKVHYYLILFYMLQNYEFQE